MTTVGCYLEAPLKGGGIQQLDRVQGYRDRVTHCQPGLNLKVGKKRPHLGTPDPIWAKCSKSGQNFSRIGQKKIIHIGVISKPQSEYFSYFGLQAGNLVNCLFNLFPSSGDRAFSDLLVSDFALS